jgi:type I site-specific restriction-modification system R (restriction) subunit
MFYLWCHTHACSYTAFVKLHEDLKTMLPKKIKLPTLPGKALVRSFNENYVQKKGNQLEEYLRFLLAIPEVYAIDEFMSFLLGNYDTLGSVFAALDQANGRYEGIHQEQLTTLKTDYERTIADLDGEIATNKATITSKAEIINEKNSVISQFSRANEEFRSIIAALKQDVSTAETLAAEAKEARLELLEEMTNHQRRKESSSASNSSKQFKTTPKNSHNQAISDANTALEIEALQSRLALAEAEAREVSGALKKIKLEKKVLIKEVKKLRKTIEGGGGGAEDTKVSQ